MGKLCEYCIPNNKNKLYTKTKEMEIVNYLKQNLRDYQFIHNKSVGNLCTSKQIFPDIRFDLDYYNVIVEIDEFQHRGADYKCDQQRMYDIIANIGVPCYFIRYNPDNLLSDKAILLNTLLKYLTIKKKQITNIFNNYGFAVEYLFYK